MTRYLVTYRGAWDLHSMFFEGETAWARAVSYARERDDPTATITNLDTGEELRWDQAVIQERGSTNGSD